MLSIVRGRFYNKLPACIKQTKQSSLQKVTQAASYKWMLLPI
jgi:hypothetical protein